MENFVNFSTRARLPSQSWLMFSYPFFFFFLFFSFWCFLFFCLASIRPVWLSYISSNEHSGVSRDWVLLAFYVEFQVAFFSTLLFSWRVFVNIESWGYFLYVWEI